jgi:fucose 4-O-acetylase-like acetyltransferase
MLPAERIEYLDTAKGVGIILVIMGHLFTYGCIPFALIFSFHMPLFFLISGFLFNPSRYKNVVSLLKDQFARFYIPYLFFTALGFGITMLIPAWSIQSYKDTFHEIFYIAQPETIHVGQIWFLVCLAVTQIFFYLLNKIFKVVRSITATCITVVILSIISILLLYDGVLFPFKIETAISATIFFLIGFFFKDKVKIQNINLFFSVSKNGIIIISLFVVGIILALYNRTVNMCTSVYNNFILFLFSALSGSIFVIYIARYISCKWLKFIGKNSLILFCIHSFFLYLYAYLISFLGDGVEYMIMENIPWFFVIIGTPIVLFLSVLCFYILNPFLKQLQMLCKIG